MEPRAMWGQVTGMGVYLFRSYWMSYESFKKYNVGDIQECLLLADTRKKYWTIRLGDEITPRILQDCLGITLSTEERMYYVTDAANNCIARLCPEWVWLGTTLTDVEEKFR